jgi:uncharacterized protein YbjT (DUF2867 family)
LNVLITGASGYIGSHVAAALEAAGHEVVEAARRPQPGAGRRSIAADFSTELDSSVWIPRLRGIECVINAVGILRESRGQSFAALHVAAPIGLFAACVRAGVPRIIQISALGAHREAASGFHRSKAEADASLAGLPLEWIVLKPSLVFGPGGASARLLASAAATPLIFLPGDGEQRVQPVHVDDVAALCVRLLDSSGWQRQELAVVGPEALSVRGLLARARLGMGLGEPRFVRVPMALVRALTGLAARLPGFPFDREALGMLERGNTAPPDAFAAALGAAPRPAVPLDLAPPAGTLTPAADWARLNWLLPLRRGAVALVWIVTGLLSLGIYPVGESHALLARVGVTGAGAAVLLYAAAALDLALGIAVFALRRLRWLWRLQIAVILVYTAIITIALPEYWLHPFGPVLKNVPLLALVVALHELERRA